MRTRRPASPPRRSRRVGSHLVVHDAKRALGGGHGVHVPPIKAGVCSMARWRSTRARSEATPRGAITSTFSRTRCGMSGRAMRKTKLKNPGGLQTRSAPSSTPQGGTHAAVGQECTGGTGGTGTGMARVRARQEGGGGRAKEVRRPGCARHPATNKKYAAAWCCARGSCGRALTEELQLALQDLHFAVEIARPRLAADGRRGARQVVLVEHRTCGRVDQHRWSSSL